MIETALHTGLEHPNALWIVLPSLLTFVAGVGAGFLAARRSAGRNEQSGANDGRSTAFDERR